MLHCLQKTLTFVPYFFFTFRCATLLLAVRFLEYIEASFPTKLASFSFSIKTFKMTSESFAFLVEVI